MLTNEPEWFPVPHEEGEQFALRVLSWKQLKNARKFADAENREVMKDLGAQFLAALSNPDAEKTARAVIKDQQYDQSHFDTQYILKTGVVDWTYKNGDGEVVPVSEEKLELLDERTAMWAKQKIIDITRPPTGDEEKNSSGDSIDT